MNVNIQSISLSSEAGIFNGQVAVVVQNNTILKKLIENIKTVVTGGLGRIIANETDAVDIYDPNLTLKGINLVYKKQNRKIK